MKAVIDWVSPLQPAPTDIAGYSMRVAKALSGDIKINSIADAKAGDLSSYSFCHDPFFNIGNDSRFHETILDMALHTTGIIVAHDFRIQDLIVARLQSRHDDWQTGYTQLMQRHYGDDGVAAARDFVAGEMSLPALSQSYPGIEIAAEMASCIITHNPALVDELAQRTGLYCALLPLPFEVPAVMPQARNVTKEGQTIDLLVFGFIGLNRCLEDICELIRERPGLRLNLAGQIGPQSLRLKVEQLKAEGYPLIDHGFMDDNGLNELIGRCDLVLNLRNPTMGEVSGSQLRIFANGGLSVVCDTGWYASLPDEAVLKIKPERVKQELAAVIDHYERDPYPLQAMRTSGYRFVKAEHDLNRFKEAFSSFMDVADEACAHGRKLLLAKHIGRNYQKAGAGAMMDGEALLSRASGLLGSQPR